MHLTETHIEHSDDHWKIEFIGDDGDIVTVQVAGDDDLDEVNVVDRARAIMVQLTAFALSVLIKFVPAISCGNRRPIR
jgi:hypothetical protein